MKNKLINFILTALILVNMIPAIGYASDTMGGYVINDEFNGDTLSEKWEVRSNDAIISVADGTLNFTGIDETNRFPSILWSVPDSQNKLYIIEYEITALGNYCPNRVILHFADGSEVEVCRNGNKGQELGFTNSKTGKFKIIVDIENGVATSYMNDSEEALNTVSIPNQKINQFQMASQTYQKSSTTYTYIKMYGVNDDVAILNSDVTEITDIDFAVCPIIPTDTNLMDYVSVDGAVIESITDCGSGVYNVKFAEPLENTSVYTLSINNLECLYGINITKSVEFTTREKKKVLDASLADTDFSGCFGETFRVGKSINVNIINEIDESEGVVVVALYDETGKMTLLNSPSIDFKTQNTQKNLTLKQDNFYGNMKIEMFVSDSLENLTQLSDKKIYTITNTDGIYETVLETVSPISSETSAVSTLDYAYDNNNLRIDFTISTDTTDEKNVNLVVMNGFDKETEEEPEYKRNNIYGLYQERTESGKAEFSVPMSDETKDYVIYYFAEGEARNKKVLRFYSSNESTNAFDLMENATSESSPTFSELAGSYADMFGINAPSSEVSTLAEALRDEKGGFEDKNDIKKVFETAEKINSKCNGDAEAFLNYINENYKFDEKVWNVFENKLNETTVEAVKNSILQNEYKNISDIKEKFNVNVLLKGIEKSQHYTQTATIIEELGKDLAGLTIDAYLRMSRKSSVDKDLTGMSFAGTAEFKAEFERLVNMYSAVVSSGGGGGGGSSRPAAGSGKGGASTVGASGSSGTDRASYPATEKTHRFTDLSSVNWAEEAIVYLYNKGIVSGKSEFTFAPEDKIKRAEFAKMIAVVFGADVSKKAEFSDISADSWYSPYVAAAFENGLMNGISKNEFNAEGNVTREMVAAVIYRTAEKSGKKFADGYKEFADSSMIEEYAVNSVKALADAGIISGTGNGEFNPKADCTRAEAAKMLYSLMKYLGK